MKVLLTLLILLSNQCYAENADSSTEAVNSRAHTFHYAVSYAFTLPTILLLEKTGMSRFESSVLGIFLINLMGAVKEMTDEHGPDIGSIRANFLGSITAGACVLVFKF